MFSSDEGCRGHPSGGVWKDTPTSKLVTTVNRVAIKEIIDLPRE